jgi:DNA polymerase III psi subunit
MKHDIPELNLLLSQSDLNQRLLIEKVLQILKVRLDELKTIEKENQRDLQFMQDSAVWLTENMLEPWANERKSSAKLRWEEFRKNWLRNNPLK